MTRLKQLLLILMLILVAAPSQAAEPEKKGIDFQGTLWGHIKDSYEWHITNIGKTPVIISLPVIVKSSTGWHFFLSNQFEEEKDAKGNRPGPYGLRHNHTYDHPPLHQLNEQVKILQKLEILCDTN